MSTDFNSEVSTTIASEEKLTLASGKVANFGYDSTAYNEDTVAGVENYDYDQHQNIPLGNATVLNTDSSILDKGVRSQASSLTRMMLNHFFGRVSYNVNKLSDHLKTFLTMFKTFIKEGDNEWSPTVLYTVGDIVYFMTTLNFEPCMRTFKCIVDCPSVNLPPVYTDGSLINTTYWKEISGKFASLTVGTTNSGNTNVATFNGSITVAGNITQSGTPYETHAEQIYTKKDNIITREDATGALPSGQYSGIKVNNYDGNGANGILAYRSDGTAVVGDESGSPVVESLQPLLTRAEENQLTNGAPLVWDATNKKAISGATSGISVIPVNSTTVSATALSNNEVVQLRFTANIDGTDTTTPLVFTWNGDTVPVKAVKNGSLVDIYAQEIDDNGTTVYRYVQNNSLISFLFDGTNLVCEGNTILISDEYYTIYADGTKVSTESMDFTDPLNTIKDEITGNKAMIRDVATGTVHTFTEHKLTVVPANTSVVGGSPVRIDLVSDILPSNASLYQAFRNLHAKKLEMSLCCRNSFSGLGDTYVTYLNKSAPIFSTQSYSTSTVTFNLSNQLTGGLSLIFVVQKVNGHWTLQLQLTSGTSNTSVTYIYEQEYVLYYYVADELIS